MNEAKEQCIQNVVECCEIDEETAINNMEFQIDGIIEDGYLIIIPGLWSYDYSNENTFFVNQIVEIDVNENDYLCIWHHAYNGVDLTVRRIGTEKECFDFMNNDSKETLDEDKTFDVDYANKNQIVIDTNEEWEIWDIIQYKESEANQHE